MLFSLLFLGLLAGSLNASILDQIRTSQTDQSFNGKIWVVLVAGSNSYFNYRHQADVYHAYQVVKQHGVAEDNIIVFHYDDIANDPENPTPGIVINKPNGKDVYHGVPKDYTKADVTPQNFLNALLGDKTLEKAGKKVLKSGPNDHVFIYFTDHGAPGLIAFPETYLYAKDLNKVLKTLHDQKRYNKLVFYLEACESGSMFEDLLPKNFNIYATTAANATESSYACYYDEKRQTYLGDLYSVNWIEDSDKKSLKSESLVKQFEKVKKETNLSHVQEYGDLRMGQLVLSQFQGAKDEQFDGTKAQITDVTDVSNVHMAIYERRIKKAQGEEKKKLEGKLLWLKEGRKFLNMHMKEIAKIFAEQFPADVLEMFGLTVEQLTEEFITQKEKLQDHNCYSKIVDKFYRECFKFTRQTQVLRKLYILANVCEATRYLVDKDSIINSGIKKMSQYCSDTYTLDNGHDLDNTSPW